MLREQMTTILKLGLRRSFVASRIGISPPTFDKWYNGGSVSDDTILKIQEYVEWFKETVANL